MGGYEYVRGQPTARRDASARQSVPDHLRPSDKTHQYHEHIRLLYDMSLYESAEPAEDHDDGCGISVRKNRIGNGYGHWWLVVEDPEFNETYGLGWWPLDWPFGGRGAWHSPRGNSLNEDTHCRCHQGNDAAHRDRIPWDQECDVRRASQVIRHPGPGRRFLAMIFRSLHTDPILLYGKGRYRTVAHASCSEIRDCLYQWRPNKPYIYGVFDCRDAIRQALADCGLEITDCRDRDTKQQPPLRHHPLVDHRSRPGGPQP